MVYKLAVYYLPSPILRTDTARYRYGRLSFEALTISREAPVPLKSRRKLKLEVGREGNCVNAVAHEASLPLKELERRRKISEAKKEQARRAREHETGVEGNDSNGPREGSLWWKELERRRKISETKKGSVPWNRGKNHSQETRKKISRTMLVVLSDPKVREKRRGMQGKQHSEKTKQLMRAAHKRNWAERLERKREQERQHNYWAQIISNSAKLGGYNEKELDWDECAKIREKREIRKHSEKNKAIDECSAQQVLGTAQQSISGR